MTVPNEFTLATMDLQTWLEDPNAVWEETFSAKQPIQALQFWLKQRFNEDSQPDDYILVYESLYWIVQEDRVDCSKSWAAVVAFNCYDNEQSLVLFR